MVSPSLALASTKVDVGATTEVAVIMAVIRRPKIHCGFIAALWLAAEEQLSQVTDGNSTWATF